jgi:predicted Rossmann-fold nucleotide-binding protein
MEAEMGIGHLEKVAAKLSEQMSPGIRLVVIGSTSFWHSESERTCSIIGQELGALANIVLITGGVPGVGEAVGRAFHRYCNYHCRNSSIYHILPHGCKSWDYGQTLFAGDDMSERREVLGRISGFYLSVEGGPGTYHEISVALSRSAVVVPVARFGGCSGELYETLIKPTFITEDAWRILGDTSATPDAIGAAVVTMFKDYTKTTDTGLGQRAGGYGT